MVTDGRGFLRDDFEPSDRYFCPSTAQCLSSFGGCDLLCSSLDG
jgi:hypothetical protein